MSGTVHNLPSKLEEPMPLVKQVSPKKIALLPKGCPCCSTPWTSWPLPSSVQRAQNSPRRPTLLNSAGGQLYQVEYAFRSICASAGTAISLSLAWLFVCRIWSARSPVRYMTSGFGLVDGLWGPHPFAISLLRYFAYVEECSAARHQLCRTLVDVYRISQRDSGLLWQVYSRPLYRAFTTLRILKLDAL